MNRSMKSPVFNLLFSYPTRLTLLQKQPVHEEEEGELTVSEPETPQETEPSVSEDQSYREIIRASELTRTGTLYQT